MNKNFPAFPVNVDDRGMSKREFAAVQIMAGMVARANYPGNSFDPKNAKYAFFAAEAVALADALIEALSK